MQVNRIYISSNFTCEVITDSINFWSKTLNANFIPEFAAFNQIFQELLNTNSQLYCPQQHNVILLRVEEWLLSGNIADFEKNIADFISSLKFYLANSKNNLYVFFTANSPEVSNNAQLSSLINLQIEKIRNEFAPVLTITFITSSEIDSYYKVSDFHDELGLKLAHVPYKREYFVAIGTILIRYIFDNIYVNFKAVAVDCDNTLWEGIVGEDGVNGIRFNNSNLLLQQRLVDLYNKGILICLCSKNNEQDVFEVFNTRAECLLKKEHLVFHRINWLSKSTNLLSLAKEINIGADSFIFIDDNPMECEEVRAHTPATVFMFPHKESDKVNFVNHNWALYKFKVTSEDQKRNELYQQEKNRNAIFNSGISINDFIQSLNLNIQIHSLQDDEISRISQLTLRTNQFNFTTGRLSEELVSQYLNNEEVFCLTVYVSDKFGDYGLVGAVFCRLQENNVFVENFILSCRSLGRGVEHKIMSQIGTFAHQKGKNKVCISFIPSSKNKPAFDFLNILNQLYFNSILKNEVVLLTFESEKLAGLSFSGIKQIVSNNMEEIKDQSDSSFFNPNNEQYNRIVEVGNIGSITNKIYELNQSRPILNSNEKTTRSGIENKLNEIWKRNIRRDYLENNDNFFDIGGKSILIPHIILEIKEVLGIELTMPNFFNYPSVRTLTDYIYSGMSIKEKIVQKSNISQSIKLAQQQRDKFRKLRSN